MPFLDFMEEKGDIHREPWETMDEFYKRLPSAFIIANDSLNLKFDCIVVDEGQSFEKDYWEVLESLLADKEESRLYIFYDDLQRIYQEKINKVPGDEDPYQLVFNVRNTAKVHKEATKFLPQEKIPECSAIEGDSVWVCIYPPDGKDCHPEHAGKGMKDALRRVLHELIQVESVSSKDIVVLTPKKSKSFIKDNQKLGPYLFTSKETNEKGAIRYATIQSYRGLERSVVILTELDPDVGNLEGLFYIGASRAKAKLIVLISEDLHEEVKEKITSGCEVNPSK